MNEKQPTELPITGPPIEPTDLSIEQPTDLPNEPTDLSIEQPTELPITGPPIGSTELPITGPPIEPTELPITGPPIESIELPITEPPIESIELPITRPPIESIELPITEPPIESIELPITEPPIDPTELPITGPPIESIDTEMLMGPTEPPIESTGSPTGLPVAPPLELLVGELATELRAKILQLETTIQNLTEELRAKDARLMEKSPDDEQMQRKRYNSKEAELMGEIREVEETMWKIPSEKKTCEEMVRHRFYSQGEIEEMQRKVAEMQERVEEKDRMIEELRENVLEKDRTIEELNSKLEELSVANKKTPRQKYIRKRSEEVRYRCFTSLSPISKSSCQLIPSNTSKISLQHQEMEINVESEKLEAKGEPEEPLMESEKKQTRFKPAVKDTSQPRKFSSVPTSPALLTRRTSKKKEKTERNTGTGKSRKWFSHVFQKFSDTS